MWIPGMQIWESNCVFPSVGWRDEGRGGGVLQYLGNGFQVENGISYIYELHSLWGKFIIVHVSAS